MSNPIKPKDLPITLKPGESVLIDVSELFLEAIRQEMGDPNIQLSDIKWTVKKEEKCPH